LYTPKSIPCESERSETTSQSGERYLYFGVLVAIWILASIFWYYFCHSLKTPRLFGDELDYWDMACSFHQGLRIPYWSVTYDSPVRLFSYVISPVFAFHDKLHAYQAARLLLPFIISSSVFPVYLLSRELLSRPYSIAAAILSVVTPCMTYSSTLMTENLYYPLFVWTFWGAYRVLCHGRIRDSLLTGLFLSLTYYTKPHVLGFAAAYALCAAIWIAASLLDGTSMSKISKWRGFGIRLIPLAVFSLVLVVRALALPPTDRHLGTILAGKTYQFELQAHKALQMTNVFAGWSGLVLATLIATAFVPFCLFVASAFRLRSMDWRLRWFWLLTAISWLTYTSLVARHTVLNDFGAIRIHERYIFMMFPLFFIWYFRNHEQCSRRFIATVSALGAAAGMAIMYWPAHVFLTPNVNSDSPSLTGFLGTAWLHNLTFFELALLVAGIACLATAAALLRKAWLQVVVWTLISVTISSGWLQFERRWINPMHVRLQKLALNVSEVIGPHATLGMLVNTRGWLLQFHLALWSEQPTILYNIDPSMILGNFNFESPNVRHLMMNQSGDLNYGTPAPDYLFSSLPLDAQLSLVRVYVDSAKTYYLYRIPKVNPEP
jgi:Dolichyl-phosphate-mannose-protein mannosyltransferase